MDQAKSIVNFNEKEFSGTMISNKSNLLNSTTYEVIKQVKSKETIKNISKTGRLRVVRIPQLVKCVPEKIRRNSIRSVRKLTKKYRVRRRPIRRIVKDEFKMSSFALQHQQNFFDLKEKKAKLIKNFVK